MKRVAYAACIVAMMAAMPAWAQSMTGIFTSKGDRIVAAQAHVSFPKTAAGLVLTSTDEFSHKGESLDSAAQYKSPNGVWGTVFVYRPGYADAALTAYETDSGMAKIYGAGIARLSQSVVALGGKPGTMIRMTYNGGVFRGATLASASGFTRIGGWIVKFRVSGPTERLAEVEAGLDALIAGTRIEGKARLFPVGTPDLAAPCPAAPSGAVKAVNDDDSMANALMSAIGGGIANDEAKGGETPIPPGFPANGLIKMCLRGPLISGERSLPVLAPAGDAKPDMLIVLLSDNGSLVMISKNLIGNRYTIIKTDIAELVTFGELDRLPDNAELARLFEGRVPGALRMRASTKWTVDGKASVNIVAPPDPAKK